MRDGSDPKEAGGDWRWDARYHAAKKQNWASIALGLGLALVLKLAPAPTFRVSIAVNLRVSDNVCVSIGAICYSSGLRGRSDLSDGRLKKNGERSCARRKSRHVTQIYSSHNSCTVRQCCCMNTRRAQDMRYSSYCCATNTPDDAHYGRNSLHFQRRIPDARTQPLVYLTPKTEAGKKVLFPHGPGKCRRTTYNTNRVSTTNCTRPG